MINHNLCCPYCNENRIYKHGKSNNIQRYKCTNTSCNRTFSANHDSPFRYAKKFKTMWENYHILMNEGLTLRQCAVNLKINLITAFFWRHKILNSYSLDNDANEIKGYVELTKLILPENFKGNRNPPAGNRGRIQIIAITSSTDVITAVPISRKLCTYKKLVELVNPKLHKDSYIIKSPNNWILLLAKLHNSNIKDIKKYDTTKTWSIPPFTTPIKKWLVRFNGVASKYIMHYVNWYITLYKNKIAPNSELSSKIRSYIKWFDIKLKDFNVDEFFDRTIYDNSSLVY